MHHLLTYTCLQYGVVQCPSSTVTSVALSRAAVGGASSRAATGIRLTWVCWIGETQCR